MLSFLSIIVSLSVVTFRKIQVRNNVFVIIFVVMLMTSMILELLANSTMTNYATETLKVYYYQSPNATELSTFSMEYQFIGYVYYSSQMAFLLAHWLFGFVYLFTAINLGFQLALDDMIYKRQEQQYERRKSFTKCSQMKFKVELVTLKSRQKSISYCLYVLCALMFIAIPVVQVVSDSKKEAQFSDANEVFDMQVFLSAGLSDLCLFACILMELLLASIFFFCLSRKYGIKFQIQ